MLECVLLSIEQRLRMGVAAYAIDVTRLDCLFGGFSPSPMGDNMAAAEKVAISEERERKRRELFDKTKALEDARVSEPMSYDDGNGTKWTYVVLDGESVRLEKCETENVELEIPLRIEGKPVLALGNDSCAALPNLEVAIIPDEILSVGFCAFRNNKKLKTISFPLYVGEYDSNWLRSCPMVENLVLPGGAENIDARVFDSPNLKTLTVGRSVKNIAPGSFAKSKLEAIKVSDENPFIKTDGRAIYSEDGTILVAMAVPGEDYEVADGCKAIAKKGMSGFGSLKKIALPDSLQVLGEFALAGTGIESFTAPSNLVAVYEKAFFNCKSLVEVSLGSSLIELGPEAFSSTGILELSVPPTVEKLGTPIANATKLIYSGPNATFKIENSENLVFDEFGGLYLNAEDGLHFAKLVDPDTERYEVRSDAVAIDENSFTRHKALKEVVIPEGITTIPEGVFRDCRKLESVTLPSTIEVIGENAFLGTSLKSVHLPASLKELGENALVTYGALRGTEPRTLAEVSVEEGNENFYTVPGMLLQRKPRGRARVILYTDTLESVRIPEEVDEISPYAFNNAKHVNELYLSNRIEYVGICGLKVDCLIEHVHIDLAEPIDGRTYYDLYFPNTDRGVHQVVQAFGTPQFVDLDAIFRCYDTSIANAKNFDINNGGMSLYEQATRILDRLTDPVFLLPVNKSMFERILQDGVEDICVAIAKHDDREAINAMLDLGFLNEGNLYTVIERVSAVQDAAMMGYLLEVKRQRFDQAAMDFDL